MLILKVIELGFFFLTLAQGYDSMNAVLSNLLDIRNISYEVPDLEIFVRSDFGQKNLEAFGTSSNIFILEKQLSSHYSKLSWYSLGTPQLIKSSLNTELPATLFHFYPFGFYTHLQLLTLEDMESLANAAYEKYNIPIKSKQIRNIPLSKLECSFLVYSNAKSVLLKGSVSNFRYYPLRIDFRAPVGSQLRQVMLDSLNSSTPEIKFTCNLEVQTQNSNVNYLSLTINDKENLELDERLFGTEQNASKFSYVTTKQLNILASEMYSYFNIMEEYKMSLSKFADLFVESILMQTSFAHFQLVSFDLAAKHFANCNLNLDETIQTLQMLKESLTQLFKVQSVGNNNYIFVNNTHVDKLINTGIIIIDESEEISISGLIHFEFSLKKMREVITNFMQLSTSLPDQIKKLNRLMQGEIVWVWDQSKLFPKFIKVAKLSRVKFNKTIKFDKIIKQKGKVLFSKTIFIYSQHAGMDDTNKLLLNKLEILLKKNNLTNEKLEQHVNSLANLTSRVAKNEALTSEFVKKCRLCVKSANNNYQLQQNQQVCSLWSSEISSYNNSYVTNSYVTNFNQYLRSGMDVMIECV